MAHEVATQIEAVPVDFGTALQSQKAELVGQMAGAMANQFNNVMMALTGYAELELKKATPAQKRNLEQILHNSARATTLIQKFLVLTQKHTPSPRTCAVNPVIEDVCGFLPPLMGEGIEISIKTDADAGSIVADPVEIEQLLLSLAVNVKETMKDGGTLQVTTELVDTESNPSGDTLDPSGRYTMLCVHSTPVNGNGKAKMDPPPGTHDLRITQAIAAVRTIVRERRGHFRVSSFPDQSTTFRIYFPTASTEAEIPGKPASSNASAPSTKTILLVDDDDAVRNPAAEFLKMEGFKVLQARTGPEALRIVQESRSHLDLLVTDIVMAGMHGTKVAEELQKTHPMLKVLFMSGDVHEAAKTRDTLARADDMLQKPFRLNKLIDKISELLEA